MKNVVAFLSVLAIATGLSSRAADADDRQACVYGKTTVQARIAACTRLISSGRFGGKALSQFYYWRAKLEAYNNNLDAAIADFAQAIRVDPRSFGSYVDRGRVYSMKKEYDLAIADFDQAIRINPRLTRAYVDRAVAQRHLGNTELARADLKTAIELPAYGSNGEYVRKSASRLLEAIDRVEAKRKEHESWKRAADRLHAMAKKNATDSRPRADKAPANLGSRIALVIGNSKYANAARLNNPANDAHAMAAALRRLGFVDVIERYDLENEQFRRELKSFGDKAADVDWALVYFAGHGIQVDETTYLIPTDAKLVRSNHIQDEAVALPYLLTKVADARKLRLVILDACRINPFYSRLEKAGGKRSLGRGLGAIEPQRGILVAYAARNGQIADDGTGKHSPYTEALLQHLEESNIEVGFLFRKVRDTVLKRTDNAQEPYVYGSLPSQGLYFKKTAQ